MKEQLIQEAKDHLRNTIEITADMCLGYDADVQEPIDYKDSSLEDATLIFAHVLFNKIWKLQENEDMWKEDRELMVNQAGKDIRKLIKTYTGVDMHKIHDNNS